MNGDSNNNTTGSVKRNTFYNIDVPEWRCENCGKFNQREARFCRSCGAPGPMAGMPANEVFVAEMPKKKGGAGKWVAIAAVIVIAVAAITFAVIKFVLPKDEPVTGSTGGQNQKITDTAGNDSNNGSGENEQPPTTTYSNYVVGGTYYVIPDEGINVRQGPGLEYSVVLNSDGKKVALRQGTAVVCEEVSEDGNWLRIPQGWICGWDGNETLVR